MQISWIFANIFISLTLIRLGGGGHDGPPPPRHIARSSRRNQALSDKTNRIKIGQEMTEK